MEDCLRQWRLKETLAGLTEGSAQHAAIAEAIAQIQARFQMTRVWGQEKQPEWARGIVWDCREPSDCEPSADSPVDHGTTDEFFKREGNALRWPDLDMLRQLSSGTGVEGNSGCEQATATV